jgi:plasmid stability protein
MRTTLTLDPDVASRVRSLAAERGISFKQAINELLRAGLAGERAARPFKVRARRLGVRPGIDLDKALQLASDLEDEEIMRKLQARK